MSVGYRNGNTPHSSNPSEQFQNWPDVKQLPALSAVASQIIQITSQDPFNWEHCIRLFQSDAGLSAKLLRLVNSSYYGLRRSISSVDRAARMLGEKTFRCLALGLAVAASLPRPKNDPFDPDLYWRDNLTRAMFAKGISQVSKSGIHDEVFSGALLQNMAIPLLIFAKGDDYLSLIKKQRISGEPLSHLEREEFGWTHADLGAWVAEKWRFPAEMVLAIRRHHDTFHGLKPLDNEEKLVAWVQIAAMLPSSKDDNLDHWRAAFDTFKEHLPTMPWKLLLERVDMAVNELAKLFQEGEVQAPPLIERLQAVDPDLAVG